VARAMPVLETKNLLVLGLVADGPGHAYKLAVPQTCSCAAARTKKGTGRALAIADVVLGRSRGQIILLK
jgi:hypothetical protein